MRKGPAVHARASQPPYCAGLVDNMACLISKLIEFSLHFTRLLRGLGPSGLELRGPIQKWPEMKLTLPILSSFAVLIPSAQIIALIGCSKAYLVLGMCVAFG